MQGAWREDEVSQSKRPPRNEKPKVNTESPKETVSRKKDLNVEKTLGLGEEEELKRMPKCACTFGEMSSQTW